MSGSRLGVIFQSTFAIVLGVCVAVAGHWKLGLAGSAFIPAILIASRWQMKIMVNTLNNLIEHSQFWWSKPE